MKEIDKHTLERAAGGDMEAFELMMRQYERLVYNIAYRMFSNSEDAKDILQEVFIKVYRNMAACRKPEYFKGWLCTVTTNTCIDELRKRRGKEAESLDAPAESAVRLKVISGEELPEDAVVGKESWREMQEALNALQDDDRLLIVLRDIEGLTYNEIAEAASLSLGTVKSRLSRARHKLRGILNASIIE